MSRIAGVNNIRTAQKVHIRSISKRRRSKFLSLFMLDNERQLLEKDNQVLQQRFGRNSERLDMINKEIGKSVADEFSKAAENSLKLKPWKIKMNRWQTRQLNVGPTDE
jgi:hypothetical protein